MLNGLLAIEMLLAVLNRLFVSVNASMASFALSFSRIDLRHIGFDFSAPLRRFDKDRIHIIYRRLGGAQPGNRFVSFVRAYARSGCLVELDLKSRCPHFPFSFLA